ncbi:hypothetical protein HFO04_07210 [Rhizobium laguerreae]|uniref:hypothetical protein n=1 Tax=Rhizobium laguerreae TaxID=1076926 RepID=UPI001C916EF9|nr:hypothetical protein [Rhizobium laguerreae]MBY3302584.1 hypothetical protein [Rhizobium laguerreae]
MGDSSADIMERVGKAMQAATAAYFAAETRTGGQIGNMQFGKPDRVSVTIHIEGASITLEMPIKRA